MGAGRGVGAGRGRVVGERSVGRGIRVEGVRVWKRVVGGRGVGAGKGVVGGSLL